MIENYIIFNGKATKEFDCYVSGGETFATAQRDYELVEVQGRNGVLVIDKERYKQVKVPYKAFIVNNMKENYKSLSNWYASNFGIHRLEDTFHPEYFRLAMFDGEIEPKVFALQLSEFTLNFICQPEKWLKTGETAIAVKNGSYINNPTLFPAKPLIKVVGEGTLNISNIVRETGEYISTYQAIISDNGQNHLYIDCESGFAYEQFYNHVESRNNCVYFNEFKLPMLKQFSIISYDDTITEVEIVPRWWEL